MQSDSEKKRIGIWIRVSTEDQARGESPEHHEERARAYALAKGWDVAEIYRLEGKSGKSVLEYPESQKMLKDAESGRIEALIFSKLARLARNTKELIELSDRFQEIGVDMVSLQESIDTSTPAGRLLYTVIAALTQWEREEISERVAASVPIRAKLGKSTGGAAVFGYEWKENHLVPHPEEAPIRKKIYETYLKEQRVATTARVLSEAGYRTRKGAKFTAPTVERLIRDTTAKGVRIANRTKSLGEGKAWKLKPESEWVTTPVEPIVEEELWNQCNEILDRHKRKLGGKPKPRKTSYLFTGYLFCHCGGVMRVSSNNRKKYVCQKCRNKIPVEDLEEIYRGELERFFVSTEEIDKQLQSAQLHAQSQSDLIKVLDKELASIEKQTDALIDLYSKGAINADSFAERNEPLQQRKAEIQTERNKLQGEADLLKIDLLNANLISEEGVKLSQRWKKMDFREKRTLVETITGQITIGTEDIHIELYCLPSLLKDT